MGAKQAKHDSSSVFKKIEKQSKLHDDEEDFLFSVHREAKTMFKGLDKNSDGSLDRDEQEVFFNNVYAWLQQGNQQFKHDQKALVAAWIDHFDENKDGCLSWEGFQKALSLFHPANRHLWDNPEQLTESTLKKLPTGLSLLSPSNQKRKNSTPRSRSSSKGEVSPSKVESDSIKSPRRRVESSPFSKAEGTPKQSRKSEGANDADDSVAKAKSVPNVSKNSQLPTSTSLPSTPIEGGRPRSSSSSTSSYVISASSSTSSSTTTTPFSPRTAASMDQPRPRSISDSPSARRVVTISSSPPSSLSTTDEKAVFDEVKFNKAKNYVIDGNFFAFSEAIEGLKVNMQDPTEMNTLLHYAVAYNNVPMAKLLIKKGAKQLANNAGMTPLELANMAYNSGDSSYFEMKNGMSGKWSNL